MTALNEQTGAGDGPGAPASPAIVLACLTDPGTPAESLAAWAGLVAPEVALRPVRPDLSALAGLGGRTPYAVLGTGPLALAAFELAGRLAAGHAPSRLLVCDCPPPAADRLGQTALSCPIVAFAGPELAGEMAAWRTASAAGFTLRVLDGELAAPPRGRATPEVALALKEELQVWPY